LKIFDPSRAVENRAAIKTAIFDHAERVVSDGVSLYSLDLSQYGIWLEPNDLSLGRAEKWTKKRITEYREEIVLLSGLWRSIAVRTNNKKREQCLRRAISVIKDSEYIKQT
jgi:hypothetical protein